MTTVKKKPFVYMATDENARFEWLCSKRTQLRLAEQLRQSALQGPAEWILEVGVVSFDTISLKAQLDTRGTRRQLQARRDRMTGYLERLAVEFELVFRLFGRPTATTYEYRASAADPDRFRTVRLTGRAAREMEDLDRYNVTGRASKRLRRILDAQLADNA